MIYLFLALVALQYIFLALDANRYDEYDNRYIYMGVIAAVLTVPIFLYMVSTGT